MTKRILKDISEFCVDPFEQNEIEKMISPEWEREFKAFLRQNLNIIDIFEKYISIDISYGDLMQILPWILPWNFAICSSNLMYPNTIKFCISLTKIIKDAMPTYGLASGFINKIFTTFKKLD